MAEVVRSNFHVLLPLIEECISRSDFLAVDTEFTGLAASPSDEPSFFDTKEERYQKLRRFAQIFIICQFGLSAFIKDPKANKYVAHTFSFYLFPRPQGHLDRRVNIQASNAEFLCEHNFDFNKFFYEGIPYLNNKQGEELLAEGTLGEKEYQEALGFTRVFRAIQRAQKPLLGHNMLNDVVLMYEKFHEPLPEHYIEFKKQLHHLFPVIIDTKNICHGLRRCLAESNLLQFSSLIELYEALGSHRGTFYVLCTPDICHSEESQKYGLQKSFHEAGFDSFCVGFVFLRIAHLVAMKGVNDMDVLASDGKGKHIYKKVEKHAKSSQAHPVSLKQYFNLMEPYSNRINLIKGPIHFIDLCGPDPPPVRSEWLVVTSRRRGEPVSLQMLQDHLGDFMSMDVRFSSPHTALVVLASRKRAHQILLEVTHLRIRKYYWILDSPTGKLLWRVSLGAVGLGLGLSTIILLRFIRKACLYCI